MRVRMKTHITGSRNGEPWPAIGECIDLPDHEATDMITNGYVDEASDASPDPERPTSRGRKARKKEASDASPDPDPDADRDADATPSAGADDPTTEDRDAPPAVDA